MKLYISTSLSGGVTFGGRRVSKDRVLTAYIINDAGHLKAFQGSEPLISDLPEKQAGKVSFINSSAEINENDAVIAEQKEDILALIKKADELVIANFKRNYPSDFDIDKNILKNFRLVCEEEITGCSHDRITIKKYKKKG